VELVDRKVLIVEKMIDWVMLVHWVQHSFHRIIFFDENHLHDELQNWNDVVVHFSILHLVVDDDDLNQSKCL
jgi:hypothetical protein